MRPLCEKFLAKGKDVYVAFMDLVKEYDRGQVLSLHGVCRKLLRALKSMYDDNRMCVRVG